LAVGGLRARWLLVVPCLVVLAVLSYSAARMGAADALTWVAAERISKWDTGRVRPGLEPWMAVRADLERASSLSRTDPVAPELLGVLHLSRAVSPDYAESALEYFRRALVMRPSSPYTWANVAEARYGMGMTAAPFEAVMLTAWRLGPAEPEVQRVMVDLGLALWGEGSPSLRDSVRAALAAAMRRKPVETLEIVARRGRLDLACPMAATDKRLVQTIWPARCQNTGGV
jgi:hypothetical protein